MGRTSEEGGLAWKGTPPPTPGKARCPRAWRSYGGERGTEGGTAEREREGGRGVWKGGGRGGALAEESRPACSSRG